MNDLNQFVELFITIFEAILIFSFFDSNLGRKYDIKTLYFVLLFICILVVYCTDKIKLFVNYKAIIVIIMYLMMSISFYNGKLRNRIIASIIIITLLIFADLVTFSIDNILKLLLQSMEFDSEYKRILMLFISKIIFFVLVKLCSKRELITYKENKLNIIYWLLLFSIPMITIILFLVVFFSLQFIPTSYNVYWLMLIASVGLLFLNLLVFYVFEALLKGSQIQLKYNLMEQQHKLQIKHFEDTGKKQNELRYIKHDIKNHIFCIQTLLCKNKLNDAIDYISHIDSRLTQTNAYSDCGNIIIDAIVNDRCSICESEGIKTIIKINIHEHLNIDNDDLCIVLVNTIDNALEACRKIDGDYKLIDICIEYKKEILFICIKNSFSNTPIMHDEKFITDKGDYEYHGIGLSNVKSTVNKYNGYVNITAKDNVFEVEIFMCNK